MDVDEFRTWFHGFFEGLDGDPPGEAQWSRLCERVAELGEARSNEIRQPAAFGAAGGEAERPRRALRGRQRAPGSAAIAAQTSRAGRKLEAVAGQDGELRAQVRS